MGKPDGRSALFLEMDAKFRAIQNNQERIIKLLEGPDGPGGRDRKDTSGNHTASYIHHSCCQFSGGMKMSCLKCAHLDRSRKSQVGKCYRYGCTASMDGYISTWINGDNLLDTISCDVDRKGGQEQQMSIFDFIK